MTSLFDRTAGLQSLLPLLADAAVKGAVLVLVAAIAVFALRKRSAAARHAVWSAAVIGHLTIPLFMLLLPAWRIPLLPAAPWMSNTATESSVANLDLSITPNSDATSPVVIDKSVVGALDKSSTEQKPVSTEPAVNSARPSEPAAVVSSGSPLTTSGVAVVATIWFVGALIVLLRLALGTWQVGRLARVGARVEDGAWLSLTQRLANRLGVSRPLTLLRGDRLAVPVTWGIVYPAVLLPQESDNWSEDQRRFVLVHEMAHVKRFDALTQLLAQLAVALFWFDPLVWIAAHQMRVEREHACDDYVLRDGTMPSLYAGELLEMVRNIGTPRHDRAAPAFAALAMARRSEFEGRMLAILDPRLDRNTLNRRGAFMTAAIVALLTIPLAALRPYQQPTPRTASTDEFPSSFKVTIHDAKAPAVPSSPSSSSLGAGVVAQATPAATVLGAAGASKAQSQLRAWSCDNFITGDKHTGTHVNVMDNDASQIVQYMATNSNRCAEAAVVGPVRFSPDETRIAEVPSGSFARFRERTGSFDRGVSVTAVGDGSVQYTATINGRGVPFDSDMQQWLSGFLPEVLREAAINVPERVARYRERGGVPAVLNMIGQIHSVSARREHYSELIKGPLTSEDAERIAMQVPKDLAASSSDLSSIIQKLPRSVFQSAGPRQALAAALDSIKSSGDKANTLEILAPNADREMLIVLAKAAEALASSGDKANYLTATAAEYLTPRNAGLREAYFRAARTIPSSGDLANVLVSAAPYGHADPAVTMSIIDVSRAVPSSGDAANVLLSLAGQRLLLATNPASAIAAIQRTLTMGSSGDRANVLLGIASTGVLSNNDVKEAFLRATAALPSDADRANVLSALARQ
ncbi:MAG TPA: M56 family metallopeptidase [Gemmatimonadaceae bacterium]|nr:M56 family metallopeptidase [Gemmatimonadaceae bacterium]